MGFPGSEWGFLAVRWIPWQQAWARALYAAPDGFYHRHRASRHFTTSVSGVPGAVHVFADAVAVLLDRLGATTFVDLAAGDGELAVAVQRRRPQVQCAAVEVRPRPKGLAPELTWLRSPGGAELPDGLDGLQDVLVMANEWLDVVPCPVLQIDDAGRARQVLVEPASGAERLGAPADPTDLDWCSRHWPLDDARPGDRVEVGSSRDAAWAGLLARVRTGTAVSVDYGHHRQARPRAGTLTGYRVGRQVPAVPDGSCDLTAHVSWDCLEHQQTLSQRAALAVLGAPATVPAADLAAAEPRSYLAALGQQAAWTALRDRQGLGGHRWVVAQRGRVPRVSDILARNGVASHG